MGLADLLTIKGGLEKMVITALEAPDNDSEISSVSVLYNPTSFSQSLKATFAEVKTDNQPAPRSIFRGMTAETLSLEFLFDATGASISEGAKPAVSGDHTEIGKVIEESGDPGQRDVVDAIDAFLGVAWKYDGEVHQPRQIKVNWGKLEFIGYMHTANITYKLFNSSGLPIRATVSATFSKNTDPVTAEAEAKKKSPDLTRIITVKEGDTLPLLAQKYYGQESLYLEIARVNKLKNFRKLSSGEKLYFPPIDKNVTGTSNS